MADVDRVFKSPMSIFEKSLRKMAFACAVISPLILLTYLSGNAIADFSSDAAMNSILARVMYDAKSVFPLDWIISNGEGPFPSTAMLIAPFLGVFSNSFQLHAIFSILMAAALIWSYWLFLKILPLNSGLQLLGVVCITMGFSYPFVRMVYVETAYFWWPFCFFVCAYLVNRGFSTSKVSYLLFSAIIIFFFSIKNPQRVAVMVLLPLMAFGISLRIDSFLAAGSILKNSLMRVFIASSIFALVAAFFATKSLAYFGLINDQSVVSGLTFAGASQAWENAKVFWNGWFLYLGSDAEIFAYQSFEPFFRAMRSTFVTLLTIFSILGVIKYIDCSRAVLRALSVAFLVSFSAIALLYIFTTSLAVNHLTMRYFTIPYLLALALALVYVIELFSSFAKFPLALNLVVIFLTISGYARMFPCPGLDCQPRLSHGMKIAQMLEAEKLEFGYANWWIAGGPTILTREKVLIAPIYVTGADISPFNYMVSRKWYEQSSQNREKFVMLYDSEATPEVLSMLRKRYGEWKREIRSVGVVVLIFDSSVIFFH